jgi:hypothetical protein
MAKASSGSADSVHKLFSAPTPENIQDALRAMSDEIQAAAEFTRAAAWMTETLDQDEAAVFSRVLGRVSMHVAGASRHIEYLQKSAFAASEG